MDRIIWHDILFPFTGGSYTGLWFFDGSILRLEIPNLLPMALWANHASDYGSINALYDLLNPLPRDEGVMLEADDIVYGIFIDQVRTQAEYRALATSLPQE